MITRVYLIVCPYKGAEIQFLFEKLFHIQNKSWVIRQQRIRTVHLSSLLAFSLLVESSIISNMILIRRFKLFQNISRFNADFIFNLTCSNRRFKGTNDFFIWIRLFIFRESIWWNISLLGAICDLDWSFDVSALNLLINFQAENS